MRLSSMNVAAAASFFCALNPQPADARSSEASVRAFEARQEAAWNAHDAKAYADCFAEDADIVNVLGWWWKSRAEAQQKLTAAGASIFARTHLRFGARGP